MKINNKLTVKEIRNIQPGRFIRVVWDDVGAEDCLVLENENHNNLKSLKIFGLNDCLVRWVNYDQIIDIGKFLRAEYTGLTNQQL